MAVRSGRPRAAIGAPYPSIAKDTGVDGSIRLILENGGCCEYALQRAKPEVPNDALDPHILVNRSQNLVRVNCHLIAGLIQNTERAQHDVLLPAGRQLQFPTSIETMSSTTVPSEKAARSLGTIPIC
jgi:hypothetical protein